MKHRYSRIAIEVVIWSAFIIFPLILFPFGPFTVDGTMHPVLRGIVLTHSFLIALYYFNYYYALPKFYFKRNYSFYFLLMGSILLLLILLLQTDPAFNPFPDPPFRYNKTVFVFSIFVRFLMITLLSLGFAGYNRLRLAEAEKLNSELSYLKAQINPHFLFNTLNSIYSLAVQKSESTQTAVVRLASIMRYVISEAAQDFVPLQREIDYLNAYIDLEKLRLTEKVKLQYQVTGDAGGKQVAPLLFIPIVENAFKHGVSASEESIVIIQIRISEQNVELLVQNSISNVNSEKSTGLGLENVRKRLELLYPGQHSLEIMKTDREFKVNLVIDFEPRPA